VKTAETPLPYVTDPRPAAQGGIVVAADLPKAGERGRWTVLYKMLIAEAVTHALIPAEEACERYCMTARELRRWVEQLDREGREGLKANNFAAAEPPEPLAHLEVFQDGPIAIDFRKRTARLADQLVDFSPKEFELLAILIRGASACVPRETVFALLYSGRERQPESKILDVMICKIRRKLGAGTIETVWGRGWQWKGPQPPKEN
jgi:Protein of unknown function (DUF1153)